MPQDAFSATTSHSDTSVSAALGYLPADAQVPVQYTFSPPAGEPWENAGYDRRDVLIRDARRLGWLPSLEQQGFSLVEAPSAIRDFRDEAQVRERYYPESEQLALALTGGREARVFDHLVRRRAPERDRPLDFGRGRQAGAAPANGRVHNDYTEASGRHRLARVLGEAAAERVRHYCIVNLWRPLIEPVEDAPLALCDARTVSALDMVSGEVRYPGRTGHIYLMRHAAGHRWYYYPAMRRSEVLLFKQYDTRLSGVSRFTPHCAFDPPDVPVAAPPRESIELRCLVILE